MIKVLGDNIKLRRQQINKSSKSVAKRLNMSHEYYKFLEKTGERLTVKDMINICIELETDPGKLFKGVFPWE